MNKARMKKLIAFLRVLPEDKFDFGSVVGRTEVKEGKPCGAVCCAMGWCPAVFPGLAEWTESEPGILDDAVKGTPALKKEAKEIAAVHGEDEGYAFFEPDLPYYSDVAAALFDLSHDDAYNLFTPDYQWELDLPDVEDQAPPAELAAVLQTYMDRCEDTTPKDQKNEPDFHPETLVAMLGLPFKRVDN